MEILQAESSNDSRTEFFNSVRTTNSSDSNILDGINFGQSSHNFCIDSENAKNVFINLLFEFFSFCVPTLLIINNLF